MRILIIVMLAALVFSCAPKAKEIPMETFVKIWLKAQGDDAFRNKYTKPFDEAPTAELDKFTIAFGFSGADAKYTKLELIDKSAERQKQFQDALLDETMRPLNEKPDTSAVIGTK